MPELNTIKQLGPISGALPNRKVNVDLQSYSNSYDAHYRPQYIQEHNRASNQSGLGQLGYGLLSRTLSIIPKLGNGVGSIVGLGKYAASGNISDIWDNPMNDFFNSMDESLKRTFPVYQSTKNAESGLLGKMATTSFWASDAFDGIAFAVSAALPGMAIGKMTRAAGEGLAALRTSALGRTLGAVDESLVSAAKTFGQLEGGMPVAKLADAGLQAMDDALLKYVARPAAKGALALRDGAKSLVNGLRQVGLDSHQTSLLLTTAYNTVAESAVEAYQTQQEIQQILMDRGIPEAQAKQQAAEAAARTFRANMTVLAVPNFIENTFFHGGWNNMQKAVRDGVWEGGGKAAKELAGLDSIWSKLAKGVATEGFWEENVQTSIQQYERAAATYGHRDPDYIGAIGKNMAHNTMGFFNSFLPGDESPDEIEGAVSIFLGGLIGGGMAVFSHAQEKAQYEKLRKFEEGRYADLFEKLGPAAAALFRENVTSIYEKNGKKMIKVGEGENAQEIEINDYKLDENGKLVISPEALMRLTINQLAQKHLWDAQMLAAYRNDPALAELNKQQALASYAHALVTSQYDYTDAELAKLLDNLTDVGDAEAKSLGIDTQITENVAQIKEYIQQIRDIKSKNGAAKTDINDPLETKFNDFLNKSMFYANAKLKALSNIRALTTNENALATIDKLIIDTTQQLQDMQNNRATIKQLYKDTIFDPEQSAVEYNRLLEKKGRTPEEEAKFKELGYRLREDSAINGKWIGSGASRQLTVGGDLKNLSRASIGSADMYQHARGLTEIALDRIETDLANPESDPIQTAVDFRDNVTVWNDSTAERIDRVRPALEQKVQERREQQNQVLQSLGAAAAIMQDLRDVSQVGEPGEESFLLDHIAANYGLGQDATTMEELEADPEIQALIQVLGEGGIEVDKNTLFDEEFIRENSDALRELEGSLRGTTGVVRQNIENLDNLLQGVRQGDGATRFNNRYKGLQDATNKEEYLKKDFYDSNIKEPVEELIEAFQEDERSGAGEFVAEVEFELAKSALEAAIAAYETRQDSNNPIDYVLNDARQKLDYLQNVMYPKMLNNLNRRAEIHKQINNEVTGNILQGLGLTKNGNPTARKLLEIVLGKEKIDELLKQVFENKEVLSFDAVNVLIEAFKTKATKEQIAELTETLANARTAKTEAFLKTLPVELKRTRDNMLRNKNLETKPVFNSAALTRLYFEDDSGAMPEIVQKFLYDGDLNALAKMAKNSRQLSKEDQDYIKNLKEAIDTINSINMLTEWLGSDAFNYSQFLATKEELDASHTPSLQQNIVLNQVFRFLNSKVTNNNYDNWMLVQGIGGSGKTFLIATTMLNIMTKMNNRAVNVYAFSKEKNTTDNINMALFNKVNDSSLTAFLSMDNEALSKMDMVIIDEVFTFTNVEIALINEKLGKVFTETGKTVKVIALGDPSQATAETESVLNKAIRLHASSPLTTSYRTNVSSIAVFNRKFQLTSKEVKGNIALANVTPEDMIADPSKATGVVAVTAEQLAQALQRPSNRKRVLIVSSQQEKVNNANKFPGVDVRMVHEAQGYQWDEVYTFLNPEELGSDNFTINRNLYTAYSRAKSLLVIAGDPTVTNTDPNTSMDATIEQANTELVLARDMFVNNLMNATKANDLLKGVPTFSQEETTPQEIQSEDAPATEPGVVSSPNYTDAQEVDPPLEVLPEPTDTSSKLHGFSYPANYGLTPVLDHMGMTRYNIALHQNAHVIRSVSNAGEKFLVVTESAWNPGNFIVVAVLSNDDFNGSAGDYFNSIIKNHDEAVDDIGINYTGFTQFGDIQRLSLGKVSIKNYNRFKTLTRGSQDYTSRPSQYLPGAKDSVEDAIIRFYISYYGPTANGTVVSQTSDPKKRWVKVLQDADGKVTYEVNWKAIGDKVQMIIPTRGTKKDPEAFGWDPAIHNPRGLSVIYGVPYLVVWPEVENQKRASKPLLIKFQPQKFNKNSHYYTAIREMYDQVRVIESVTGLALGSEEFAALVRDYARENFRIEKAESQLHEGTFKYNLVLGDNLVPMNEYTDTEDAIELNKLRKALNTIVPLIFGTKEQTKYFYSEEEATDYMEKNGTPFENTVYRVIDGKLIVKAAPTKDDRNLWTLQVSTDPQDREGSTTAYRSIDMVEGEGPAQVALNSLAQANNTVGMEQYQLRETIKARQDRRTFKILRAPSILISDAYTDYDAFFADEFVQELLGSDAYNGRYKTYGALVSALATALEDGGHETADTSRKAAVDMLDNFTTQPITSEYLDMIVGDNAFDREGEHQLGDTYLRMPLRLHTLNNTGVNDFGKNLSDPAARQALSQITRHNFDSFSRTFVLFNIPTDEPTPRKPKKKVKKPEKKPVVTPLGDLLKKIKKTGNAEQDSLADLLRKLPIQDTPVYYNPKGVPVSVPVTPDNPEGIKYMTNVFGSGFDHDTQQWVIVGDASFHNMNDTPGRVVELMHEALHIATQPQLHKGRSDARKGLDTPEALLYTRLQSLKKRFDSAIRSKINPKTGKRYKTSDVYMKTQSKLDVFEFIANLSNPVFINLAKEVSVVPRGSKKSVLREILEAIVDFFKGILGIDNMNVYEATVASLEAYYGLIGESGPAIPIAQEVAPKAAAKHSKKDILDKLTKSLNVSDFYTFEANLEHIKNNMFHIIDKLSLPEAYGEEFELEFSEEFLAKPEAEQATIIDSLTMKLSDLNFAYYNVQQDLTTASPGGINTTRGITNVVDRAFKDEELTPNELNLIRSITMRAAIDRTFMDNFLASADDPMALSELLYNKVLSQKDRVNFMEAVNATTDREAAGAIFSDPENPIYQSVLKVANVVVNRYEDIQNIVSSVEDRAASRYVAAKNFVLSVLRANLAKDNALANSEDPESLENLIRDRREVLREVQKLVSSPNTTLPSGHTVKDASKVLSGYYEELDGYRSLKRLGKKANDRVHELITVLIPQLEDELAGITALKESDSVTGKSILGKIIEDIYPKYNLEDEEDLQLAVELNQLADAEYISREEADVDLEETVNISEYLQEYNKSYELTLSESIKDYLSHIRVGDRTISNALAYIKTMQLAVSLDWSNGLSNKTGNAILDQLYARLRNESGLSNLDRAIIQTMIDTITLALGSRYTDGVTLTTSQRGNTFGIVSVTSPKGVVTYAAFRINDPTVRNPQHLTYDELRNLQRSNGNVEVSKTFLTTEELYNWMKIKQPHLTVRQFNRHFTKAEAINVVRGIHNTMASMKETELYIATKQVRGGNVMRMIRSKASGISYSIKDVVRYNLYNLYEEGKLESLASQFKLRRVNGRTMTALSTGTPQEKEIFIREFFSEIGFRDIAQQIAIKLADVPDLVNEIEGFLSKADHVQKYNAATEYVDENNTIEKPAFQDWVEDEVGGYINRFSELLAKSDDLYRNPSVRDSNGNKFYKFHESSWAYDVFLGLMDITKNNPVFRGGSGTNSERKVPEFLLSDFYNHNIFVRGKIFNRLYSIGEYEAAKNEDTGTVTPYTRENMYYFFHRKFVQGFLDGARQYRDSYFQFSYIPSDKPKHPMLRVGLLSDNSKGGKSPILGAIEQALTQIFEREQALDKLDVANYDNSVRNDKFRNFQIAGKAIKELGVEFTSDNIPKIAEKVYELMSEEASQLLDELLSKEIGLTFDKGTYSITRYLKDKLNPDFKLNAEMMADESGRKDSTFKNRAKNEYAVSKEDILPLFDLFFKNNYINSYFLNQLISGDYMAYKKDSSDIIKRYAGVFGPGLRPLVDESIGMSNKFKVLVLADTVIEKADTRQRLLNLLFDGKEPKGKEAAEFNNLLEFFEDRFESTDAQGFMLPRRFRQLTRGFERSWGLGQVHKPVHFEVRKHDIKDEEGNVIYSTAIPVYLKYSAVVLDDALVDKFPTLRKMRDVIERMGVDEVVFNSAVKEGMPTVRNEAGELLNGNGKSLSFNQITNLSEEEAKAVANLYKNPPILELDNRNYRLQHNPQSDPNKQISLFTQLMYFLNVYPDKLQNGEFADTQEAAQQAYELVAELIKMGRDQFSKEISTPAQMRNFLLKKFNGPGAERALDLLQNHISINHPLLEKRTIIALASGLEKATVKVKFPGGKLVLQTAEGIDLYQDPNLFKLDDETRKLGQDLQYQMEEIEVDGKKRRIMVAQVVVPREMLTKEQLAAVARKESVYLLPDAMGFRIPSTELHSAVPLRVVGVYSNKLTNVVIAPRELVPIHGSDFDVDALFVITKELYDAKETTIINSGYIVKYLQNLSKVLKELNESQLNTSTAGALKLKKLREDVKKLSGIMNDIDQSEDAEDLNQESVEQRFQQHINTPQPMAGSNKPIIRSSLKDFNEARARASWGTKHGYKWSPSDSVWVPADSLRGKAETIARRIDKFIADNPELAPSVTALRDAMQQVEDAKSGTTATLLGEAGTPVGYKRVAVRGVTKYVLDPNYLETINTNLEHLKDLEATMQPELAPLVMRDVKANIRNLESVKQKYLKNRIIDIMLTVISDEANKYRMLTPISFAPLTRAIDLIPTELVGDTSYDLSNLADEYRAYAALVSGAILTGAFANASKSFGYFARAGANEKIERYYDILQSTKRFLKYASAMATKMPADEWDTMNREEFVSLAKRMMEFSSRENEKLPEEFEAKLAKIASGQYEEELVRENPDAVVDWHHTILKIYESFAKHKKNVVLGNFSVVNTSPKLNKGLVFDIMHNGSINTYDRLAIKDSNDEYSVTQVYDALTNEAIDNLKLGDLVKARINPKTGSAVIGLVSVGVPMEVIVKLLYQPILAPLSSGKVDNINRWISALTKEYKEELEVVSKMPINTADLEKFLSEKDQDGNFVYHRFQEMTHNKMEAKLSEEEFFVQLQALRLFLIGHQIGEDMRNMSNFLNIIRQQDVFIEDIFQLHDNLEDKIGTPEELETGEMALIPRTDYSFVVPNLFENAPHVREAYKAQLDLIGLIQANLKIHSKEIVAFSEMVNGFGALVDESGEKAQARKAKIRRSLSFYVLSGLAAEALEGEKSEVVQVGDNKITLSPLRAYSNRVANRLWKVREFAYRNNDSNLFLRNVSIIRDTYSTARIAFKSGVNLNSEDVRAIVLGFKSLNQYGFDDNGDVIRVTPNSPNSESELQRELMNYAILNYGLQFSSSNYSSYIPASMLVRIDDLYNGRLDMLINDIRTGKDIVGFATHFGLSHILQNSTSLPYVMGDSIVPFRARGNGNSATYPGSKKIQMKDSTGELKEQTVYYDLEVKRAKEDGSIVDTPMFIRTEFGNKVRVYARVAYDNDSAFYQKVGRVSDAFHTPLSRDAAYELETYFDYSVPSLEYHYESGKRIFTFSKAVDSLKKGDKIWIYPSYNFDRTQRRFVEITGVSKSESKEAPGFYIDVIPAEVPAPLVVEEKPTKPKLAKAPKLSNPQFVQYNGESLFSDAKKDPVTGEYDNQGQTLKSVTQDVIPIFQTRPFKGEETLGVRIANSLWAGEDPTILKLTDMSVQPVTKDEYVRMVDASYQIGIAKGTIFHKLVHQYVSKDPNTQGELQQLYAENHILPDEFSWLDGNTIKQIINKTGTNAYAKDAKLRTDRLYTEKVIASPLLGWAGTADMWIDHGDNIYSVFDLKTGRAFNRMFENSFLKYGRTSVADIFDSPRNRAKLQVMLYAFMAKVEHPEARFRNLELLHVRDKWSIGEPDAFRHVNVQAMLEIIQNTLKAEHPLIYAKLEKLGHFKSIFDPASYMTNDSASFENNHPGADPAMLLKLKILELQGLVMYDKDIIGNVLRDDYASRDRYKRIEELMEEIIKLRNDQSLSYASWDTDMGWMDRWLGSPSASTNPYVKMYYSLLTENKQKARNKYLTWREKLNALIRALQKESGTKPITSLIGGTNREKLFGFALKKEEVGDTFRTRFVTEKDSEWSSLTDTQKKFLVFANDSIGMFFDNKLSDYEDPITGKKVALANQVITYRKRGGREVPVTNLDLYNKTFDKSSGARREKFVYKRGFFPKHPPQLVDVAARHGGYFSQGVLRFIWNRNMTNYFEAVYDNWFNTDEAIPMKYLGGNGIEMSGNYTMNVELALDAFVKQHYYKQHLDQTYAFAQATKLYLTAKENAGNGITYDRLIDWFENSIDLHILGRRQKEIKFGTRTFGRINKGQYQQFNAVKFLRSVKNFFTGPTMWLKPLTGLPNFVFASLVTLKEGLKNSLGLGTANANFDLADIAFGFKEAFKLYLWDGRSDDAYKQSKAYLLMEKFGYLPDSYDWYTRPNQLLTARNRMFSSRSMMIFHSLPEEVISTAIFVAQLKSMEFTNTEGVKTNMWEAYDTTTETLSDGTAYTNIEWKGGIRGKRNVSNVSDKPIYEDVTEMTNEEMNHVKFLYEKMHGGYRIDERVAAEYYIFGEMMLQLKKFMPAMLKNVWASRGIRQTQGYFEKITDDNGNEVLKWKPQVIEGRYRLILGMLFNALSIKQSKTNGEKGNKVLEFLGFQYDESYKWSELSEAQKEDLWDFAITSLMWIAMLFGYFNLWDRDDEDTLKKIYGRIMNDTAGYVNPLEIGKNITNMIQPISVRKGYKLVESSAELLWSTMLYGAGYDDEALTKQGNFRGWSEFQRNVHFLSAYHDLQKGARESNWLSERNK